MDKTLDQMTVEELTDAAIAMVRLWYAHSKKVHGLSYVDMADCAMCNTYHAELAQINATAVERKAQKGDK